MAIETIGEAYSLGWRLTAPCMQGKYEGESRRESADIARSWILQRWSGLEAQRFRCPRWRAD
jgi:hypothetical protein